MKTYLIYPLLFLLTNNFVSAGNDYKYPERTGAWVKKENLSTIKFLNELSPNFWKYIQVGREEWEELEKRRKADSAQGYFVNPGENIYSKIVDYCSSEIMVINNGKKFSAKSTGNKLSQEQLNMLNTADLGSSVSVKLKFRFKERPEFTLYNAGKIMEGEINVTVVPYKEIQLAGGIKETRKFIADYVMEKTGSAKAAKKANNAVIRFTVNEKGDIISPAIRTSSTDLLIDKLILEAVSKLPACIPAKNAKGENVRQEFELNMFEGGC